MADVWDCVCGEKDVNGLYCQGCDRSRQTSDQVRQWIERTHRTVPGESKLCVTLDDEEQGFESDAYRARVGRMLTWWERMVDRTEKAKKARDEMISKPHPIVCADHPEYWLSDIDCPVCCKIMGWGDPNFDVVDDSSGQPEGPADKTDAN